jgi:hypothetical protein
MRKLISAVAVIFWAVACRVETNNSPSKIEAWGPITNGVQISVRMTNGVVPTGGIVYFSVAVTNGAANGIILPGNHTEIELPFVFGELIDGSGKRFTMRPKPLASQSLGKSFSIPPGTATYWIVRLPVLTFDEHQHLRESDEGIFHDVVPGNYEFRAKVGFWGKDQTYSFALSNPLSFQVK